MKHLCVNAYMYEQWVNMILDLGLTPYLSIIRGGEERPYSIPEEYFNGDKIILNVNPDAVSNYHLDKETGILSFGARFKGMPVECIVPLEMADFVYAKENQFAMSLPQTLTLIDTDGKDLLRDYADGRVRAGLELKAEPKAEPKAKGFLKVVK